MFNREYQSLDSIDADNIQVAITGERNGKPYISMTYQKDGCNIPIALVSPACQTHWPRCTGDGNFGTMYGPSEPAKTKFTLDLVDIDSQINEQENEGFAKLKQLLDTLDDKLLELVFNNQFGCINHRNLTKDECRMLQNRTVRPKLDKISGNVAGHSLMLSAPKFVTDQQTKSVRERKINICDHTGAVIPDAHVYAGDIVAATMYLSNIHTGVCDKFGITWGFEDVCVICQRTVMDQKPHVQVFSETQSPFASPYVSVNAGLLTSNEVNANQSKDTQFAEADAMYIM
ncbi:MAG: hypothetical protein SGPRY_012286 [Prymnesium sp.]